MIEIGISTPTGWAFLDCEMLDIAHFSVIEYRTTLNLMGLADTISMAAISFHTFSRTSTVM